MNEHKHGVAILGIFVADLAFRAGRMPGMGETIAGSGFKMGPGGKGSNQAVAAARVGAEVTFITRIGKDDFGASALATWAERASTRRRRKAPISRPARRSSTSTIEPARTPSSLFPALPVPSASADVEAASDAISRAAVFVTQLEQPVAAAFRGLEIARAAGTVTVFNPAPAEPVDDAIYALCDFVTPNESEAAMLTGIPVANVDEARKAGDVFLAKGVGTALITLGEAGALLHSRNASTMIPAFRVGPVVETTGAGDAFNGGFVAALAAGANAADAARFGCAVAGISVTRAGTAPSMPNRAEVEALLAGAG